MKQDDCDLLGNVIKAHGLNGEIQAFLDADEPGSYTVLESIFILMNNKLIPFFIETIQINGNKALIKLEGVDSREASEDLANHQIYLPLSFLPELPADKYYYHEIVGYDFFDGENLLGQVENVITLSAQTLLTLNVEGTEVLVPLQEGIISKVDKQLQRIMANLPEGLLDVYLSNDSENEN